MQVTKQEMRDAFEAWHNDYQLHPKNYVSNAKHKATPPKEYGESATDHFVAIIKQQRSE